MMRAYPDMRLRVLACILCIVGPLFAQRSDRAIITGVVADPTASSVPGTTIKIRNEGTGVETVLTTNDAGAYTTPPLVVGSYTLTVDHAGFKTSVKTGVLLQGGDTIREDVTLVVGAVTESVDVKAEAEQLNVTTPDVSHTVGEKYYQDLPIITAADVRLAEAMLQIQPGYLPMKPNGDPQFRGSQFNSRISGGQTMATENFFDGAAFGYAVGHQQSHESAPPMESIQEMRVITTTYSAQYGHTSGGFIEYTSKSGTNTLHGSAYEFLANDALNARGFFDADCNSIGECRPGQKTPVRNNSFGFTLGGPVAIPKVYNGHNKTFFFTNFDWTRFRSGVLSGFGNTTPTDAFKTGDFSELLTKDQIGNDALARPIFEGQVFNPATSRVVNGIPVRDPYPGNIIPASDPLRSAVAAKIAALMVHPDRAGVAFNVVGSQAGNQTGLLNARTILVRVDHGFTPNFRMSESFYWNHRPSIRNCGWVAGCKTQFDGEKEPEKNNTYYGNGFYQRISTHHSHMQFDWIIRNTLLHHTTVAWDRWFMGGNPLSAGVGWPKVLWGADQGGILDNTAGPPEIDFQGSIPYTFLGAGGWPRFGFQTNNRWQFSDDLSWVKAKHTFKVGIDYRHHQFPFAGWGTYAQGGEFAFNNLETRSYDSAGNNLGQTGDPFASFLLGQVHFSTQTIPFHPMFNEACTAPWINDQFKMTRQLTLTLGLRFDYQFARTESHDQYSTFDPSTPNPGAGNLPGALIFAGEGAGRTGSRTFEKPELSSWGPRLGFAYRVGDKSAIRGGYGIYYSGISFDQFMGQPTIGFQSNPFAVTLNNGQSPAFYLDDGFPKNLITFPPFVDPSFANGTPPLAVAKNGLTLPRYQNWSLTAEHQLTSNMRLDVSYIADRGTRLINNWQSMGLAANMNDPRVLSLGSNVLGTTCNSASCPTGITLPYTNFNGDVAQALRKYPHFQSIMWRNVPTGSSVYNALEVLLEQRYSHGLGFRVGYTYSKLDNDGAESAISGNGINVTVQNPACPHKCEWGLSQDDTPNIFLVGFTWEVPFAKSMSSGVGGFLLSGWNLAGMLRYESGRPLNIFMNNNLAGFLFNGQKRPDRVKAVTAVKRSSNFNPLIQNYFSAGAWTNPAGDPDALVFGNAPRADGSVRGFPNYNEDLNLFKVFSSKEGLNMRFEALFGNIFNRTVFCDPNNNFSAESFGMVNTQCNQPRSIQFGLKLYY